MSASPLLQISDLDVSYHVQGREINALKKVSLDIPKPGYTLGIVGESGSGKTTLGLSIMNLIKPPGLVKGGKIRYQGQDVLEMTATELRKYRWQEVSMVYQAAMNSLNPVKPISHPIIEVFREHLNLPSREARKRTLDLLSSVGIGSDRLDFYPHEISGGMRQRVIVALALALSPKLLIADEPTSALDVVTQKGILKLLKKYVTEHQISLIFITHEISLLYGLVDNVAVMHQGTIVELGTTDQVLFKPQHPYTRTLLGSLLTGDKASDLQKFNERSSNQSTITGNSFHFDVKKLNVQFKKGGKLSRKKSVVNAVRNVNLSLSEGEVLSIVGESGSGKTTLAKCIVKLIKPNSGSIEYNGKNVPDLKGKALLEYRKDVQIVYQDPYESLNPREDVFDIVSQPIIRLKGKMDRKLLENAVSAALREVGLDPEIIMHRFPHQLSGGERQRVNIARALGPEPKVLVADEPVTMLDASQRLSIMQLLLDLKWRKNLSIIMITHDLMTASIVSKRMIVMYLGRIVEAGETKDIISNPHHPYVELMLKAMPSLKVRLEDYSEVSFIEASEEVHEGCIFRPRCKYATSICEQVEPNLEVKSNDHMAACHNPLNVRVEQVPKLSES